MRVIIAKDYDEMSVWAANYVAQRILDAKPTPEKPFVLGCPTGSSPLGLYKHLIELNKKGVISFQNVVTFNMDEYVGLDVNHPELPQLHVEQFLQPHRHQTRECPYPRRQCSRPFGRMCPL